MRPKTRQPDGPERTSGHKKWPAEVRLRLAQTVVDRGASVAAVGQTFGIPATTIAEWARHQEVGGRRCGDAEGSGRSAARSGCTACGGGAVTPGAP
jgi:transposase-like protein